MELSIPSASLPVGPGAGSHGDAGGSSAMLSPSFLPLGKPAERRLSSPGVGEGEPCPASGYIFHPLFIKMEISAAAWLAALRRAGAGEMQVEDGDQRRGKALCTAGRDAGGGPVVFPHGFPLRNPREVCAAGCTRQAAGFSCSARHRGAAEGCQGWLAARRVPGGRARRAGSSSAGPRGGTSVCPGGRTALLQCGAGAAPGLASGRGARRGDGAGAAGTRGAVCECVHVCVSVSSSMGLQAKCAQGRADAGVLVRTNCVHVRLCPCLCMCVSAQSCLAVSLCVCVHNVQRYVPPCACTRMECAGGCVPACACTSVHGCASP